MQRAEQKAVGRNQMGKKFRQDRAGPVLGIGSEAVGGEALSMGTERR